MRRFDKGVIVGDKDPRTDPVVWVRAEIAHARKLDPNPYVQGRLGCLIEVLSHLAREENQP